MSMIKWFTCVLFLLGFQWQLQASQPWYSSYAQKLQEISPHVTSALIGSLGGAGLGVGIGHTMGYNWRQQALMGAMIGAMGGLLANYGEPWLRMKLSPLPPAVPDNKPLQSTAQLLESSKIPKTSSLESQPVPKKSPNKSGMYQHLQKMLDRPMETLALMFDAVCNQINSGRWPTEEPSKLMITLLTGEEVTQRFFFELFKKEYAYIKGNFWDPRISETVESLLDKAIFKGYMDLSDLRSMAIIFLALTNVTEKLRQSCRLLIQIIDRFNQSQQQALPKNVVVVPVVHQSREEQKNQLGRIDI